MKHENLSVFNALYTSEAEYLWREVDIIAIQKLEMRMKVNTKNNMIAIALSLILHISTCSVSNYDNI